MIGTPSSSATVHSGSRLRSCSAGRPAGRCSASPRRVSGRAQAATRSAAAASPSRVATDARIHVPPPSVGAVSAIASFSRRAQSLAWSGGIPPDWTSIHGESTCSVTPTFDIHRGAAPSRSSGRGSGGVAVPGTWTIQPSRYGRRRSRRVAGAVSSPASSDCGTTWACTSVTIFRRTHLASLRRAGFFEAMAGRAA